MTDDRRDARPPAAGGLTYASTTDTNGGPDAGAVVDALSRSRLRPDLVQAGGNAARALASHDHRHLVLGLEVWRRALYAELVVRTAIAGHLERTYGPWWFTPTSTLRPHLNRHAATSLDKATSHSGPRPTSRTVVEQTTFDLWRFLLRGEYQTSIWRGHGCAATFPQHGNDRKAIEARVAVIYTQRNLVAHHHRLTRPPRLVHDHCRYVVDAASREAAAHFDTLFPTPPR